MGQSCVLAFLFFTSVCRRRSTCNSGDGEWRRRLACSWVGACAEREVEEKAFFHPAHTPQALDQLRSKVGLVTSPSVFLEALVVHPAYPPTTPPPSLRSCPPPPPRFPCALSLSHASNAGIIFGRCKCTRRFTFSMPGRKPSQCWPADCQSSSAAAIAFTTNTPCRLQCACPRERPRGRALLLLLLRRRRHRQRSHQRDQQHQQEHQRQRQQQHQQLQQIPTQQQRPRGSSSSTSASRRRKERT